MKHIFIILLTIAIIVTGIFLPYIPGDYDLFAVGFSYIFQFGIFSSLLLVPTGLIWLILNISVGQKQQISKYSIYLKKTTLIITVIMVLASALGAFASGSRFSAFFILGVGIFLLTIQKKLNFHPFPNSIIPYYLIIIPLTVVFIRLTYFEKAKNKTTDFAIQQSAPLIHDIEAYKSANGHYPVSIQSTIEDYHTSVSGIQRFHYEPTKNAYNLYFVQISNRLGTEEIVMYNKAEEHEMTVHNQDLLRIPTENILRGYHKVVELPQQHWKIFYFD